MFVACDDATSVRERDEVMVCIPSRVHDASFDADVVPRGTVPRHDEVARRCDDK